MRKRDVSWQPRLRPTSGTTLNASELCRPRFESCASSPPAKVALPAGDRIWVLPPIVASRCVLPSATLLVHDRNQGPRQRTPASPSWPPSKVLVVRNASLTRKRVPGGGRIGKATGLVALT